MAKKAKPNRLIFEDSEKARDAITVSQKKHIQNLYNDWADDLEERAKYYKAKDTASYALKEQNAKQLRKALQEQGQQIANEVYSSTKQSIHLVADAVVKNNTQWLKELGIASNTAIDMAFASVPDHIVRMLVTGQLYKGGWNLSSKIWGNNEKTLSNCYEIVAGGLAENKPLYEIAKELEKYVRPTAGKPWNPLIRMKNKQTGQWEYVRIYKGKVDYNAQRLARTLIQHGYQQAFIAVTEKNPFIERYQWSANGSRPCPICRARDGAIYAKGDLPMDHPNGMCTMIPVVATDLVERLARWFNSPSGTYPDIDEFARSLGAKNI